MLTPERSQRIQELAAQLVGECRTAGIKTLLLSTYPDRHTISAWAPTVQVLAEKTTGHLHLSRQPGQGIGDFLYRMPMYISTSVAGLQVWAVGPAYEVIPVLEAHGMQVGPAAQGQRDGEGGL